MKVMDKIKENKWTLVLTVILCLLVGWIILFKMSFSISTLDRIRGINLIPFYYDEEISFHLTEVAMNVLAFIPLGLFLKLLKFDFKSSVLLGFGYSFILEIMQLILKVGITDITDLITNTSGIVIGVAFYVALSKIFKNTNMLDKALKMLATIGVVLIIAFVSILIIANL